MKVRYIAKFTAYYTRKLISVSIFLVLKWGQSSPWRSCDSTCTLSAVIYGWECRDQVTTAAKTTWRSTYVYSKTTATAVLRPFLLIVWLIFSTIHLDRRLRITLFGVVCDSKEQYTPMFWLRQGDHGEREPITGVWGLSPQRGPGAEPHWSRKPFSFWTSKKSGKFALF